MQNLFGNIRYALRQFRLSPVFAATAMLTLALGIGGTTAIFTLIHAVMLRSLPVSDPATLYRIGDSDDCCVQGGPQDRWGMFSFPLYQRLMSDAPEFEQLAAFQAGLRRSSVRRQGVELSAQPLRSEYVTGNYFSTLGIRLIRWPRVHARRRYSRRRARCGDQPPRVGDDLRRRSICRWIYFLRRGPSIHDNRYLTTRIFR